MTMHPKTSTQNEINKIINYAKANLTTAEEEKIFKFIRLFYSQAWSGDLKKHNVADLYGAALSQLELMQRRKPGQRKLRLFNPDYESDGWQSTHTIIQLVMDDMPFVIDSMRMELDRLGLTTHLMMYMGGMKVLRDKKGELLEILDYDSEHKDAIIEAPILMEIDRQTDPEFLKSITEDLERILNDVTLAVTDWGKMKARLDEAIAELAGLGKAVNQENLKESLAFLEWLLEDHFTFLGARDYVIVNGDKNKALRLVNGSGLGVLRDETNSKTYRHISDLPEQAQELMWGDNLLIVSKTNTSSTVHRPSPNGTDLIGIKRFNEKGELIGIRRFIGLYTSTAYSQDPRIIPLQRDKVKKIFKLSNLPARSHAGKDLMYILSTLPRDDLILASVEELFDLATEILHLQERRRIRLFIRTDAYGHYYSCILFLPRENFTTDLVKRIQALLLKELNGFDVNYNIQFSESILARVYFIVRVKRKDVVAYDVSLIEQKIVEMAKSWHDGFREAALDYFGEERGNALIVKYRPAFPAGYREGFAPRNAVYDIEYMEKLESDVTLEMSFYRPLGARRNFMKFKLFRAEKTVPLSDAMPILENMGLQVIGEVPYHVICAEGQEYWINDFNMTYSSEPTFNLEDVKAKFQETFNCVWNGSAENDILNRLVLEAQLGWREISLLRAYSKYLQQTRFIFSPQYIAEALVNNPELSRLLIDLFHSSFDPDYQGKKVDSILKKITSQLDEVASLDEDRIIRRMVEVIQATLRTNYFQYNAEGNFKRYISLKLNPRKIPDLPLPLPQYEVFVYSANFEGVHLRAGKVARGGIRWSDRREDFRTEVLGLMKAQQVKNALIVPAGAKGGFVPKNIPADASREEVMQCGVACYQDFIRGLLDLIDNLQGNRVITPERTKTYDGDDPYFVVAADKGTATFSDIANQLSLERDYWLGDAFASGGSKGYDHKKMGITARGAWVSAELHFQEKGIDLQKDSVTTVGIGDMSGDVFGNGMLLSDKLKLVAAFNHLHIFLDPDPDPAVSFKERKRLFELPRSSWTDYQPELISKGGGVYSRSLKSIPISPEVQAMLGVESDHMVPSELIKHILMAQVDFLWNGGIGTYVKAATETDEDAGDRSNDAVRVNGSQVRARVVSEGGNLGFTQLGRIEYELSGGRINTDFVDNSGGVDCSDHEVNIKILLDNVVASSDLTQKQRNNLLLSMTDEVAELVLKNNYRQNREISVAAYFSPTHIQAFSRYLDALEQADSIDREIDFLPDSKTLLDRKVSGLGLTRPELAVLFARSKIMLEESILSTELVKDPYLSRFVQYAFPVPLRKKYARLLAKHRLADEIIATQLSNHIVSHMGIMFTHQMHNETGAPISAIVRAFMTVYEIFHLDQFMKDINSLDYVIDAEARFHLVNDVIRLVRRATRWFLRNRREHIDIEASIKQFSTYIKKLFKTLPTLLLSSYKKRWQKRLDTMVANRVPKDIAIRIASAPPMYHALNIIEAAKNNDADVDQVAKIYFTLVERLDLFWFREQIDQFAEDSLWSVLAKAAYKGDLDWIQRALVIGVINLDTQAKTVASRISAWFKKHDGLITRWHDVLADLRGLEGKDFAILSVAVRELSDLAQTSLETKS